MEENSMNFKILTPIHIIYNMISYEDVYEIDIQLVTLMNLLYLKPCLHKCVVPLRSD